MQNFEEIIDYQNRDYKDNAIYPSKSWFNKLRYEGYDRSTRNSKIDGANGTLVITHDDADGLVSGALFKDYYKDVTVTPISYDAMNETFDRVAENTDSIDRLLVADLNLDSVYPSIETIAKEIEEVKWFDHHEWGNREQQLRDMGIDITVDRNKCGARIVFDYLKSQGYSYSRTAAEIVDLTEDHDLWLKESDSVTISGEEKLLSDIISTVAFFSDNDDFMDNILDYGKDFRDYKNKMLKDYAKGDNFMESKVQEDRKKRNYIKNNHTDIEEIGGYTVAFVYGRASPGKLLEELGEEEGVQILVLMRPKGKISIRSDDSFQHCHKIAESVGGGGHEQAAGAFPDYADDWGLGEYAHHWNQKGHSGLRRHLENKVSDAIFQYGDT